MSKIQIKRTTTAGRTPNTTNSSNTSFIDVAELALNTTDRKLFSTDGTTLFEIGSQLSSLTVSGTAAANVLSAPYVDVTPVASEPAALEGRLFYSNTAHALSLYTDIANTPLTIGETTWIRVFNNTGSTIAKGASLYNTGATGGVTTVGLALANAYATTRSIGLAASDIANGAYGVVITRGKFSNINLSTYNINDVVYVSYTAAGGLTKTVPPSPNYPYRVGIVTSNTVTGSLNIALESESFEILRVTGTAVVEGNFTVSSNAVVSGSATLTGPVVAQNTVSMQNTLTVSTNFFVDTTGSVSTPAANVGSYFKANSTMLTVGSILSSNATAVKITADNALAFNDGTTQNTAFRVYDSAGARLA
jgi:hypothetical protein